MQDFELSSLNRQNRPRIKICGTTSVQDAELCAEAGADALGFIFAPMSRRLVATKVARDAGLSVGLVSRVGVFLDQGLDEVLSIAESARVNAVQLHGQLSSLYIREVARYYPVLRVLRPSDLGNEDVLDILELPHVTPMLDAPEPGSGIPLDWQELKNLFPVNAWLAGGLGPHNVRQAIEILCPAGVDAVSQLESRPGVKDPASVYAFVRAARSAFS